MADGGQQLRGIDWREMFPFTHLFRAFRLAYQPTNMILAFCAVVLMYCAGRGMDGLHAVLNEDSRPWDWSDREGTDSTTSDSGFKTSEFDAFRQFPDEPKHYEIQPSTKGQPVDGEDGELPIPRAGVFQLALEKTRAAQGKLASGVLSLSPGRIHAALSDMAWVKLWMFRLHWFYATVFSLICLAIMGLCGGAICRTIALDFAREQRIGWKEALLFSRSKLASFVGAPLFPMAILVGVGLVMAASGLLGAIPVLGDVFGGVLFFVPIALGVVFAVVVVGMIGGSWLMTPAIAAESSDAFDALSRTYSYVFARPWRLVFYWLVSLLYGAICFVFIKYVARLMLFAACTFGGAPINWDGVTTGEGDAAVTQGKMDYVWRGPSLDFSTPFWGRFPVNEDGQASWLQFFLKCWVYGVVGLVAAFGLSFFYSSSTIIYFLLRREVDATDLEEVYTEEDEAQGLPPLDAKPQAASEGGHSKEGTGSGGSSLPILGQ